MRHSGLHVQLLRIKRKSKYTLIYIHTFYTLYFLALRAEDWVVCILEINQHKILTKGLYCLTDSAKIINLLQTVSLWCEYGCKHSIYVKKSDKWIIWWAKFELGCMLLIFIHSNPKLFVKHGLWMPVNQDSYQRGTI